MITGPTLEYYVLGTPVAQPRPRVFRARNGRVVTATDPDGKTSAWKDSIIVETCRAMAGNREFEMFTLAKGQPLGMRLEFRMPKPVAKRAEEIYSVSRPDIDNLAKCVIDAIFTIPGFGDDARVAELELAKYYCPERDRTGVGIVIGRAYSGVASLVGRNYTALGSRPEGIPVISMDQLPLASSHASNADV